MRDATERHCTSCNRLIPWGYQGASEGGGIGPEVGGMCMVCIEPNLCARCGKLAPAGLQIDPTDVEVGIPEGRRRRLCHSCLSMVSPQMRQAA